MHYYQFNIADYRKDTQHLSPIEHYIYRELMDWYYLDEAPIPRETQRVIRRLRLVSENNQDVQNVLDEFFTDTEKGWVHGRIESEIAKYRAKAETAKANGSKGGRPKKPKKTQPVNLANPEKTGSKANHKPITNNQVKDKPLCPEPPAVAPDDAVLIKIPTNKYNTEHEEYPVRQSLITEMAELYPSVNLGDEFRAMRAWSLTNQPKRKTLGGMPRFINTWLADKQNKGGSNAANRLTGNSGTAGSKQTPGQRSRESQRAAIERDAGRQSPDQRVLGSYV